MNNEKNVKEMTREELEQELSYLRTKYIWGIQPEDLAAVACDNESIPPNTGTYSTEEMSDDALRAKLFESQKGKFAMYTWAEDVSYYLEDGLSEDDWKIIATMEKRRMAYN